MIRLNIPYEIPDLFASVFGIRHYNISSQSDNKETVHYDITGKTPEQKKVRDSYLGTPVLTHIVFQGKSYQTFDKDGKLVEVDMKDFELPVATLTSIARRKKIIETPVSTGTVKELFGFNEWDININGFCLPDPNQPQKLTTPQQQIDMLRKWEKLADSIRLKGGLPIHPDIHNIVIKDFSTWELKGMPDMIPFSIKAISDRPVELILL